MLRVSPGAGAAQVSRDGPDSVELANHGTCPAPGMDDLETSMRQTNGRLLAGRLLKSAGNGCRGRILGPPLSLSQCSSEKDRLLPSQLIPPRQSRSCSSVIEA